jgi:WD40 repeat protein
MLVRNAAILAGTIIACANDAATASAQIIDFETLPGGGSTVDLQQIHAEYASLGVRFRVLDPVTGDSIGVPRIAKVGAPLTAFEGCLDADTPRPEFNLGSSFLTDGTTLGVDGDLQIEFDSPIAKASGVILDIDCRTAGGPPCEQWTIEAYDAADSLLQSVILDAPQGPNPGCLTPDAGPGDGGAFGWVIDVGTATVSSILLRYTGAATGVGLAFDTFNVGGAPGPSSVNIASSADTICPGETMVLTSDVTGGLPPFVYQWQEEVSPGNWSDLGSGVSEPVSPYGTRRYRLSVTDDLAQQTTSAPLELVVISGPPLCSTSLLVSSNTNSSVIRYSFQSRQPVVLVPDGLGSLNGTSKLVCGGDGMLYVCSQNNDRVLRYNGETGAFVDVFVTAGSGGLDVPVGLDFGPDGNLYVASATQHAVYRYSGSTGAFLDIFVPNGSGLNAPTGLLFGPDNHLYVSSLNGDKVLRFDGATGAPMGDFVAAGSGGLDAPRGLTFGPDGNLYVAEQFNDSVRRFDGTTGAFIDIFVTSGSGGLDRANDVAFGPDGNCYVASFDNSRVLAYDGTSGAFLAELPPGSLDGAAWFAVGCVAFTTSVSLSDEGLRGLRIEPNVPNPFTPHTRIAFTLPSAGRTRVTVVDVAGRTVATLLNTVAAAGRHAIEWDARDDGGRVVPAGLYFLRVHSGGAVQGLKMLRVE